MRSVVACDPRHRSRRQWADHAFAIPADWYATVPGVVATGPLNAHFVRDIGAAHLVAGVTLAVWFAIDKAKLDRRRSPVRRSLPLHALVHLWDAAAGRAHAHQLHVDLPAVFLPPALAIWIAWPRRQANEEKSHDRMVSAAADRRL